MLSLLLEVEGSDDEDDDNARSNKKFGKDPEVDGAEDDDEDDEQDGIDILESKEHWNCCACRVEESIVVNKQAGRNETRKKKTDDTRE